MLAPIEKPVQERAQRAFFVDSENGINSLIEGIENLNRSDRVVVFHRNAVPKNAQLRIEMCPAAVDWIACVDPGVKNSMDVQIIAELSACLQADKFESGFIVSNDKGYLPALHYLERSTRGEGHTLALVSSIEKGIARNMSEFFHALKEASTRQQLARAFALVMGEEGAKSTLDKLSALLVQPAKEQLENAQSENLAEGAVLRSADDITVPTQTSSKQEHLSFKKTRGIGKALSCKLEEAGIETPLALKEVGSLEAWRRIHEEDKSFSVRWIYTFEAVVQGVSLDQLDQARKAELKKDAKKCIAA